jgi:hypothetical protein
MKVWPIDPLVLRNLKLEVPEKLYCGDFNSRLKVSASSVSVTERHCQIAGRPLELEIPPLGRKTQVCTRLTTSGMVKTLKIGLSAAKPYGAT